MRPVSGEVGSGAATGVMAGVGDTVGAAAGDSVADGLAGPEQEAIVAIAGTATTMAMMIDGDPWGLAVDAAGSEIGPCEKIIVVVNILSI